MQGKANGDQMEGCTAAWYWTAVSVHDNCAQTHLNVDAMHLWVKPLLGVQVNQPEGLHTGQHQIGIMVYNLLEKWLNLLDWRSRCHTSACAISAQNFNNLSAFSPVTKQR